MGEMDSFEPAKTTNEKKTIFSVSFLAKIRIFFNFNISAGKWTINCGGACQMPKTF